MFGFASERGGAAISTDAIPDVRGDARRVVILIRTRKKSADDAVPEPVVRKRDILAIILYRKEADAAPLGLYVWDPVLFALPGCSRADRRDFRHCHRSG